MIQQIGNSLWLRHFQSLLMSTTALAIVLAPQLPTSLARSDEPSSSPAESDATKKARAARLEVMRRHAQSLGLATTSGGNTKAAQLNAAPLLHYSNPAGETLDATLWSWGTRGRPVALASISQEISDFKTPKWSCELVSLADESILLTAKPGWTWEPPNSTIDWQPVAEAPAPGETAVVRARQMKDIARRYSATGTYRDGREVVELRLMDRPLSRYSDPNTGLIDGALYAFAGGTNPEVLLLVECRRQKGQTVWFYGFARMGAGQLIARLGDKTVWERPAINRWDPKATYFSTYGSVETVFGPESTDH